MKFFYSLPMQHPPDVQEAKYLSISVWFFFKSNLVLKDKCLNENEYSKMQVF